MAILPVRVYRIDIPHAETQPFRLYVLDGKQVAAADQFCLCHNWFTGVQRIWDGCRVCALRLHYNMVCRPYRGLLSPYVRIGVFV